jgi:hypothetical protein
VQAVRRCGRPTEETRRFLGGGILFTDSYGFRTMPAERLAGARYHPWGWHTFSVVELG